MKVKFVCDSGVNIHSRREEEIDLCELWGMSEEDAKEEWEGMTEEERYK